ncbi:Wadjet anti-phage system protein JetA family protein [Lysinibacillus sp. FSL K6-0057]|uniref:Wadjet anti-phage system protein JetA family protein n=1 Tax=Lysinibacillus sp. FSL K6-0057 TaxID=2921411 RepID=UPI00315AC843
MKISLNLFTNIPNNFFSILSGNLKEVHTDLLYLVYEHYKKTIYVIEKDVVIDLFVEYLEINDDTDKYTENEEFIKDLRERAHHYLLKFCQHGWLYQEQYLDYRYRISIPDYSIRLLDTFEKISSGYQMEFSGTVLAIYQNLSGEAGSSYYAIQQAYENTVSLINGLKELNHNIKNYIEKLMEQDNAKEVLEQLFNEYNEKVLGRHYYRLKSSDNVSKYRTKTIDRVRNLRHQLHNIEDQAQIMVKEQFANTVTEAENMLFDWLEAIENAFENIYAIMREIDERNRKYHRAAITQINFHLNKSGNFTSMVNNILCFLANASKEGDSSFKNQIEDELEQFIELYTQQYIDGKSIKTINKRKQVIQQTPMKNRTVSEDVKNKKIKEYKQQLQNEITVQKVNKYVNTILTDRSSLNLSDFPFNNKEDYINMIFTVLHSTNNKATYLVKLKDEKIKHLDVEKGTIPNMEVEKREE